MYTCYAVFQIIAILVYKADSVDTKYRPNVVLLLGQRWWHWLNVSCLLGIERGRAMYGSSGNNI